MADDASAIAEFFVKLAYKLDEGGAKKFEATIVGNEKAVDALNATITTLGKNLQELGNRLSGLEHPGRKAGEAVRKFGLSLDTLKKGVVGVGTTAIATGGAWVGMVQKVAHEYDQLGLTARRIGGSIAGLRAAQQAGAQSGIKNVLGTAEALVDAAKSNVAIASRISQVANRSFRDIQKNGDVVKDALLPVMKQLEDIYKTGEAGAQRARQMAEDWYNIPRGFLDDWMGGGKEAYEKAAKDVAAANKAAGLDDEKIKKLSAQSREMVENLSRVAFRLGNIFSVTFGEAIPKLNEGLQWVVDKLDLIANWFRDNPGFGIPASVGIALASVLGLTTALSSLRWLIFGGAAPGSGLIGALTKLGPLVKVATGPFGILIGVAIEAGLHWRELCNAFVDLGKSISDAASLVVRNLTPAFEAIKPVLDAALVPVTALINGFQSLITKFKEWVGLRETTAADKSKPGYVPGYGPTTPNIYGDTNKPAAETPIPPPPGGFGPTPPAPMPGQHPTGEFYSPYGGVKKPGAQHGGIVPIDAHAGEMILPPKLSRLFLGLANTLGSSKSAFAEGGDFGTTAQAAGKLMDWLGGLLVPKVQIDNTDELGGEGAGPGGAGAGGGGGGSGGGVGGRFGGMGPGRAGGASGAGGRGGGGSGRGGGGRLELPTSALEAISQAEGTTKDGKINYDDMLGHVGGPLGTPPKPISQMSLDEVDTWQTQMLNNPNNKWNSSAAGAFQIIRTTLRGLREKHGLKGHEKFDSTMQSMLAGSIWAEQGSGAWEGFKAHEDLRARATALAKQGKMIPGEGGGGAAASGSADPDLDKQINALSVDNARRGGASPAVGLDTEFKARIAAAHQQMPPHLQRLFKIYSGYRSAARQAIVHGSVKHSHHTGTGEEGSGMAADVQQNAELRAWLHSRPELGIGFPLAGKIAGEEHHMEPLEDGKRITNMSAWRQKYDAIRRQQAAAKERPLKAGGALTTPVNTDFDRALAPLERSGLAPGAGGDTINNNGNNSNSNTTINNHTTINGNNESSGMTEARYRRAHGDIYRNVRTRAA